MGSDRSLPCFPHPPWTGWSGDVACKPPPAFHRYSTSVNIAWRRAGVKYLCDNRKVYLGLKHKLLHLRKREVNRVWAFIGQGLDVLIIKLPALLLIFIIILSCEEVKRGHFALFLCFGLVQAISGDRDVMQGICSSSRQDYDVRLEYNLLWNLLELLWCCRQVLVLLSIVIGESH